MEKQYSSSEEKLLLLLSADPRKTQYDEASQNPQSPELGFITPQSSETDVTLSSSYPDHGSIRVIHEELKQLQHQQKQYPSRVNEGCRDHFDSRNVLYEEGELRKTLDEEIQQVIFEEGLNEVVMNLALEDRNAMEGDVKLQNFINEGICGLSLGRTAVEGTEHASGWTAISGLKEANNNQNNGNEKEVENGIKTEVSKEENGAKGNSGYMVEKVAQNGKHENESEEEDNYGTEEGENGGDHMAPNEDGGYSGGRNYGRRFPYPLRPDAEECAYYMKTGNCKFGANCKFNHPPKRRNQGVKETAKPRIEDSEQLGPNECKYYLTSGGCKYGKACKYNHSRERSLEFNFLGLPIRLGEKECPYYMRTGSCKYGSNCRFNHPDPSSVAGTDYPATVYGNGGSVQLQSATQKSTPSSWSSVPMMFPPNQGVPSSNPEWNGYRAPVYSTSERSLPTPPAFAMNNPATVATSFYAPHQLQMPVEEYPERPGQPECSYFLKTGDCKYKSNCRYHHPKIHMSRSRPCPLSDKGLPLRPDQSICSYYNRYGICKFGPSCKFDHPENWGNLASSDGARMARKEMGAGLS